MGVGGEAGGKGPLGRTRYRWEDNIEMHLEEGGWCGIDWMDMAQRRDRWRAGVTVVMQLWVGKVGKFLDRLRTGK
jgi:hypothetical protein